MRRKLGRASYVSHWLNKHALISFHDAAPHTMSFKASTYPIGIWLRSQEIRIGLFLINCTPPLPCWLQHFFMRMAKAATVHVREDLMSNVICLCIWLALFKHPYFNYMESMPFSSFLFVRDHLSSSLSFPHAQRVGDRVRKDMRNWSVLLTTSTSGRVNETNASPAVVAVALRWSQGVHGISS